MKKILIFLLLFITACDSEVNENPQNNIAFQKIDFSGDHIEYAKIKNYLLAFASKELQNLDAAIKYYENLVKQDEDREKYLSDLFTLYVLKGEIDKAEPLIKEYHDKNPADSNSALSLALINIANDNIRYAKEIFNSKALQNDTSFIFKFIKSWLYAKEKNYNMAVSIIDELGELSYYSGMHTLHKGLISDYMGKQEEAKKYFKQLESASLSFHNLSLIVNFYNRIGENKKAFLLINNYLKNNDHSWAVKKLEKTLENNGETQAIINDYKDGIAQSLYNASVIGAYSNVADYSLIFAQLSYYLNNDYDYVKLLLGELFEKTNQIQEANKYYEKIKEKSFLFVEAKIRHALNIYELGEKKKAIKSLKILSKSRTSYEVYFELANLFKDMDEHENAIEYYQKALELYKKDWKVYYNMAHIYDETGDWRNAEKALLAALKLKPNEPLILNYLGYSWVDKGKNNEKALKMIEKAMIMMPMNPNIIDSLGWAYYKIGQHGKAVKIIKASLKFAPLNPTINYHLGEIYYSLGRFLEAKYQFEKAISYDKENELNKEVITEIEKKIKKINLKI